MSGCLHYDCKVDIKSPCCSEFFSCRLCHDQQKNEEEKDYKKRHTIDRYSIPAVRCRECQHEQEPEASCKSCGIQFASYFCKICRLYESNPAKIIFHCEGCKICRIGPEEKFFHCQVCECCLDISTKDSHTCRAGVTKQNCPICLESLFFSRDSSTPLNCGHFVHRKCYKNMCTQGVYRCPVCLKSIFKSDQYTEMVDNEIQNTPMPDEYQEFFVNILCNDCQKGSKIKFHVLGLKCQECGSYNTRMV